MVPFTFDFKEMPSVFSKKMIFEQAKFVSLALKSIMSRDQYKDLPFQMIGHSMGGVVNYLATTLKDFPLDQLKTMVTLSSPLSPSPQFFNDDILLL